MTRQISLFIVATLMFSAAACSQGNARPSGSVQVVGPIILDETQPSTEVTVGRSVVFSVEDPGAWALSANPANLVLLTPGGDQDGAVFNPGADTLDTGIVEIKLLNSMTGQELVFELTIIE